MYDEIPVDGCVVGYTYEEEDTCMNREMLLWMCVCRCVARCLYWMSTCTGCVSDACVDVYLSVFRYAVYVYKG
jgi:hypothetical protein